jgi:hypothetical protein
MALHLTWSRLGRRFRLTLTFKALLPRQIRHRKRRSPLAADRCPPGLLLFRDFTPGHRPALPRQIPSCASNSPETKIEISQISDQCCAPRSTLCRDWLTSCEAAAPHELLHLLRIPRIQTSDNPGLWFHHGLHVLLPTLALPFRKIQTPYRSPSAFVVGAPRWNFAA